VKKSLVAEFREVDDEALRRKGRRQGPFMARDFDIVMQPGA